MTSSASASTSSITAQLPRFAEHMEPHEICYQLSKSGKTRQLKQFMTRRTSVDRERIIATKYNGATALIMACRNGHYDIVEYLVEQCNANLEQSGLVNFEGENIEGAPPLWCASAAGHLRIVKYLVSKGASVNSTTKSNSTALRAACFDGHFDIVRFLVENKADIEIANRHGHTCLMIACYKGHATIARYLIQQGADLNRKSVKGNTALHDCAECGSLEIMKMLLSHCAHMAPDAYQMTPLLAAAVTGHHAIVEYLLTRDECTELEKVHALELLGATFVDKKHDMMTAYAYWKKALERRAAARTLPASTEDESVASPLNKVPQQPPIEAYDFAAEFVTLAELDEIIADPDDMRMQALLIRERILGPTHPDTTYYIRYRGAVYADCGNFRKCILLWLYALDTQQKCLEPLHPMIQSSFLSFTELFQYMQKHLGHNNGWADYALSSPNLHQRARSSAASSPGGGGGDAPLSPASNDINMLNMLTMYTGTVLKILQQAVEEVKKGLKLLANAKTTITTTFDASHFDRTLVVIVHFLVVVAESLHYCSPEETFKLKKLVYELVKLNPKNSKQSTLLHLASTRDSSSVIKNHTLSSFPSSEVLKLLLECGAEPNALDLERNTALHLAASNRHVASSAAAAAAAAAAAGAGSPPPAPSSSNNAAAGAALVTPPSSNNNNANNSQQQQSSPSSSSAFLPSSERDRLICILLGAGAHLDVCNVQRKMPCDVYKGGKMYGTVVNPVNYLTLQCLAAKVIQKHNIAYKEHLTSKLADFVAMH